MSPEELAVFRAALINYASAEAQVVGDTPPSYRSDRIISAFRGGWSAGVIEGWNARDSLG